MEKEIERTLLAESRGPAWGLSCNVWQRRRWLLDGSQNGRGSWTASVAAVDARAELAVGVQCHLNPLRLRLGLLVARVDSCCGLKGGRERRQRAGLSSGGRRGGWGRGGRRHAGQRRVAIDVVVGRQAREECAPVHVVEAERWVAVHEHSAALDRRQRWQTCAKISQVGELSEITISDLRLRVCTRKLGDGWGAKPSRKGKGPIEAASIVQMLPYFWRLSGLLPKEHSAKGTNKVPLF